MQNNYSKHNESQEATSKEQKGFWDLRNKDVDYSEIVIAPIKHGANARGLDTGNKYEIAKNGAEGAKEMTVRSDLETLTKSQREVDNYQQAEPGRFLDRYANCAGHNTIQIDKNCASCQTGFAP